MKREEEIRIAIDNIFPYGDSGRTYEQSIAASGFEAGVKWADKNPINVWHDVSEEPMDRKRTIVFYVNNPVGVISYSYEDILLVIGETWPSFVILSNASLWAYLDELLPKGGEE